MRSLFVLLVLCTLASPLLAQPEHIEWGEIPDGDLRMTTYEADSNATAVVLVDHGEVYIDRDLRITLERFRRVKILTEAGYDWGTVEVPFLDEDRAQRVRRIRGQTFTIRADGAVQRTEMDGDAVFEEDIDGRWKQMKFTLPALEPGAVIEYRYKWTSKNPVFIPEWQFQYDEPVRWSGYTAEIPGTLDYVFSKRGSLIVPPRTSEDYTRYGTQGHRHHWVMTDVPALREEPFMTTPDDYRTRLSFQMQGHRLRGYYESVLGTWEEVAEQLMDGRDFGRQLRGDRDVRRQVKTVLQDADADDEQARMVALYDYVRTNVEWDGKRRYYTESDVDDVLERKSGSSGELTFLLLNMLREADLTAYPVLISTRDHGQVMESYPMVRQFNDVLAYAEADGQPYLLSPTNPVRPYTVLPTRALNGRGWLVEEEAPRWIDIHATEQHGRLVFAQLKLLADGTLEGSMQTSEEGYSAVSKRRQLREDGEDDFIRSVILDDVEGLEIASHSIEHRDDVVEPMETHAEFTAPHFAQVAGDFIYLNPFIVDRLDENPLRLPERTFPVDMSYRRTLQYTLSLEVPDGYVVTELPQNQRVQIPDGTAAYRRLITEANGYITMRSTLRMKRAVYQPRDYDVLRSFYDQVVATQAQPIVLRRVPESTPPDAPAQGSAVGDAGDR